MNEKPETSKTLILDYLRDRLTSLEADYERGKAFFASLSHGKQRECHASHAAMQRSLLDQIEDTRDEIKRIEETPDE